MKARHFALLLVVAAAVAGCGRQTVTGSYGSGVVSGRVTMASWMTSASPAGVEVSIPSTGMMQVLAADGRFTFAGVPADADLRFVRHDGIDAKLSTAAVRGPLEIELSKDAARLRKRTA